MESVLPGQDLWLRILEKVEIEVKRPHFLTWFQNTAILSFHDGLLVIGAPNIFAKDWLENKLGASFFETGETVYPKALYNSFY